MRNEEFNEGSMIQEDCFISLGSEILAVQDLERGLGLLTQRQHQEMSTMKNQRPASLSCSSECQE